MHRAYHGTAKNWICEICGNAYKIRKVLASHIKIAHTGIRPKVNCDVCGKEIMKSRLKIHMVVHREERPFSCSVCPSSFKLKKYLAAHYKNHLHSSNKK